MPTGDYPPNRLVSNWLTNPFEDSFRHEASEASLKSLHAQHIFDHLVAFHFPRSSWPRLERIQVVDMPTRVWTGSVRYSDDRTEQVNGRDLTLYGTDPDDNPYQRFPEYAMHLWIRTLPMYNALEIDKFSIVSFAYNNDSGLDWIARVELREVPGMVNIIEGAGKKLHARQEFRNRSPINRPLMFSYQRDQPATIVPMTEEELQSRRTCRTFGKEAWDRHFEHERE